MVLLEVICLGFNDNNISSVCCLLWKFVKFWIEEKMKRLNDLCRIYCNYVKGWLFFVDFLVLIIDEILWNGGDINIGYFIGLL